MVEQTAMCNQSVIKRKNYILCHDICTMKQSIIIIFVTPMISVVVLSKIVVVVDRLFDRLIETPFQPDVNRAKEQFRSLIQKNNDEEALVFPLFIRFYSRSPHK